MKLWWFGAVFVLCGAAAAIVSLFSSAPPPTYHGKNAEQWFVDPTLSFIALHKGMPAGPGGMPEDGLKAFLEMDGRVVPYLARVARRSPNAWTTGYEAVYKRAPRFLQGLLPAARSAKEYRGRQLRALTLLGTIAYWDARPHSWPTQHSVGADEIALQAVQACFSDKDGEVRSMAAAAAACMHEKAGGLIPGLIRLLGDPPARFEAVNALGCFGRSASNAVPILHSMMGKSGSMVDPIIVRVLGEIGPPAAPALKSIVPILDNPDYWAARSAAMAIYGIGTTPTDAIPALIRLTNGSVMIQARQCAALALWNLDRNDLGLIQSLSNAVCELPVMGLYHLQAAKLDRSASNLVPMLHALTNNTQTNIAARALALVQRIQQP